MNVKRNFIFFGIVLIALPFIFSTQTFLISIFSQILIYSIAAFGLNILIGYAGQISIGHAAFLAIGAYLSAVLTKNFNFPFIVTIFLSGGLSGLFGLALGFPALRLTGFYLAIATMAFGIAIEQVFAAWEYVGGNIGIRNIPNPDLFGIPVDTDLGKYLIIVFFTLLLFIVGYNILKSKTGRALKAIRESEFAARSAGIDVAKYKLIAFVISAVYAGMAGSLYAHTINYISPIDFGLGHSINLLAMIVVGGLASMSGNFIGAILMIGIPFLFSRANLPMSIIFGVLLVVVVMFFPRGLGYGLYILNWKYFGKPWAYIKKLIRKMKFRRDEAMFVKTKNGSVHYETGGDPSGKPVFMVHGNFASWRWYKPVLDRLEGTGIKGISLDLPGFGDSDRLPNEISIENYAEDLNVFINTFDMKKVNLVAHSLGGAVAMKYAINNPEKVEKMLLIDPAPADGLQTPEEAYPILDSYRSNRSLLKFALQGIMPSGDPDKMLSKLTDDALMMDPRAFKDNARALEKYNYLNDLNKLNFPVLVLVGEKDMLINEKMLEKTVEALPDCEIKTLEGVGHSVIVEYPGLFVDILKQFFGK